MTIIENNGIHEIYINAEGNDKSEVTELMKYVLDSFEYNPKFPKISARVQYFKHDSGRNDSMNKALEDFLAKGKAEERTEVLNVLGLTEADYQKILNNKAAQPVVPEEILNNGFC